MNWFLLIIVLVCIFVSIFCLFMNPNRNLGSINNFENTVTFKEDILPLFREKDINSMKGKFDLSNYDDVKNNYEKIYEKLSTKEMPCDKPWSDTMINTFKQWIDQGLKP